MEKRYLIDTSVAIKYLNESFSENALQWLDSVLDQECNLSVITKMELLVWQTEDEDEMRALTSFVDSSQILHLSDSIVDRTVEVRKKSRVKLPDSIIAATALVYDLTLVADNDKDFRKIDGLAYLNPKTV